MRLVCPSCGETASADSWRNDALARESLVILARMPSKLGDSVLGYLTLFRASNKRPLAWKKSLRLLKEIDELVGRGYVHVHGKPDKSAGPDTWAAAMDQMVERRATLKPPMPNHNYLCQVAWGLADKLDFESENKASAFPSGRPRVRRPAALKNPIDAWVQGEREEKPTDEEMAVWKRQYAESMRSENSPASVEGLAKINKLIQGVCDGQE